MLLHYDTFRPLAKCLLCLICGQAGKWIQEQIPKASSWANKMRTCKRKKEKLLSLQMKVPVPVRKFGGWVYQSATAGCRLKAWLTALLCFFLLDSAWKGTREIDGRCSQQHRSFCWHSCICPPPGLPGGVYCIYVISEIQRSKWLYISNK